MTTSLSRVEGPGDAELISAVRGGDVDAYGELFARHVDAARRLARQLTGPADADDLVSDAFTKVLLVLQRGGGPDLAFRAYLLTAVRRLHVDRLRSGSKLRSVGDLEPFDPGVPFHDTAVEGFDNAAAARAFASLPERWQMVLWHTEVEQQKPADVAPLLGMSANSVSALAYRAREGLRQAFLSQHTADPDDVDCAWTRDHLGAYIRGGLSRRDTARVDDHLETCRGCAAVYLELNEVNSGLAALIAPMLLGTAGVAYYSSLGVHGSGGASAAWTATKSFLGGHTAVTAVGGVLLTAAASVAVYVGAQAVLAHNSHNADAGTLDRPPVATHSAHHGQPGKHHGQPGNHGHHHGRNPGDSGGPTSPTSGPTTGTTLPTSPTSPTSAPTSVTTEPSSPPTSEPTSGTTSDPGQQTITFTSTPPVDPAFGDTYQVKADGSAGDRVTFSIDGSTTNQACTIDGSTVTFQHAGTCVINADTAASRGAAAGPAQQQVTVPQADQQVDFTSVAPGGAVVSGTPYTVDAKGGHSGNPVTFSIGNGTSNAACSLGKDGQTVHSDHIGTCVVAADQAGNDDYRDAPTVTQAFTITPGSPHVQFALPGNGAVGTGDDLSATSDSGGQIGFAIDPATTNNACTLNGAGTRVLYDHVGTCAVTATIAATDDFDAASAGESVAIGTGTPTIQFSLPGNGAVGTGDDLSATSDSGGQISFAIDPATTNNACTLNGAGTRVLYDHVGTCAVTATTAATADYDAASAGESVTVGKGTPTIQFTLPGTGAVGSSDNLTATSDSDGALTFTIDPATTNNACTLDNGGTVVRYRHVGTCVVTVTQDATPDWAPASVGESVAVGKGTPTVQFTLPGTGAVGTGGDLTATSDSDGAITFTVDPATTNNACTLNGAGTRVLYQHVGACAVTATAAATNDYDSASTTQNVAVGQGTPTLQFTLPGTGTVGTGDNLTATSDSGGAIVFTVDPASTAICSLDNGGTVVRYRHVGTCSVTATQAATADYAAPAPVTQKVVVGKGVQTIQFTSAAPAAPAFGDTYRVSATSTSGNPVTFSIDPSTTGQACTLKGNTVTFRHAGSCVIDADQAGGPDYSPAPTATQSVTVPQASQTITFTSTAPSPAFVGTSYVVAATGGASGNPVTFTSVTPGVCGVSGTKVSFLATGLCTISADQAGTADYQAAQTQSQTVGVTVRTADLSISAVVSGLPPIFLDRHWHQVDVTVHDLAPGSTATVTGDADLKNVLVVPEFNCWFQANGICHVKSPPTETTVTFFVWMPNGSKTSQVTFQVASDTSPDPDPTNDTVTVTVNEWNA